jgi:nitrate reductase beta subunit
VFFFSQFNPKPNITSRREDEEKNQYKMGWTTHNKGKYYFEQGKISDWDYSKLSPKPKEIILILQV